MKKKNINFMVKFVLLLKFYKIQGACRKCGAMGGHVVALVRDSLLCLMRTWRCPRRCAGDSPALLLFCRHHLQKVCYQNLLENEMMHLIQ